MLKNHIAAFNKKHMQEQITRYSNEIEELQLEREESKKNLIHFMREAEMGRKELKKAQELIEEMTVRQVGFISPPPEFTDEDQEDPFRNGVNVKKVSNLMSRLILLDEQKIDTLYNLVDDDKNIHHLTAQLNEAHSDTMQYKSDIMSLTEEIDQMRKEKEAIRLALCIENERAETIESRWRMTEDNLEKTENQVQLLEKEVDKLRKLQLTQSVQPQQSNKNKEITELKQQVESVETHYKESQNYCSQLQSDLSDTRKIADEWKEKHDTLVLRIHTQENKEREIEQARIRENQLRITTKTLRDELRKASKPRPEPVNLEYLRNVIIKFIEQKETRNDLIPILCNLLQCSKEDQTRLYHSLTKISKRKRNNIIIPSFTS